MLCVKSISFISRKAEVAKFRLNLHKRPINISRPGINNIKIAYRFLPLPASGTNNNKNDFNKVSKDSYKRYHYIGYSEKRTGVASINTQEAKQFEERLRNAADLYDGWFSRNVEKMDLAPRPSSAS